jgi:hypothetical protein
MITFKVSLLSLSDAIKKADKKNSTTNVIPFLNLGIKPQFILKITNWLLPILFKLYLFWISLLPPTVSVWCVRDCGLQTCQVTTQN